MNKLPLKLQPWFDARKKFKLSHAEIQMARELGLNPQKFGGIANHQQESWKVPIGQFIANCYRKSFGRNAPAKVVTLEEVMTVARERKLAKAARKSGGATEKAPVSASEMSCTPSINAFRSRGLTSRSS